MWPSYTPTYVNKIDQILNNNPDRNSESVLNELLINQEDLTSEFKRSNPKLLDFFRDNQKLVLKLVEYISLESSDISNVDRCFKYPLVSSEIFDCTPACIMTQFFVESKEDNATQVRIKNKANCQSVKPNSGDQDDDCCDGDTSHSEISAADASDVIKEIEEKSASATQIPSQDQEQNEEPVKKQASKQKDFKWPVMNQLFQFLEPLISINEVLAGYWSKVVLSLIQMKPQEMIEYILTSKGVLDGLFRHINNQSIASVVSTLLILESNKFSSQTQEFLKDFTEIKVKAIGQFIDKFGEYQAEEISNLANIFTEIISKYYLIQDGKEMLEYLCSEESIEKIFKYMVEGSDSAKNGASMIIQSLAQYYAFNANSFISGYPEGSEYYVIMLQQYENMAFLQTLISSFDAFADILSIKENAAGGNQRDTLGIHRLKILEVMNQVIRIQFPSVQEGLVNSKILQRMLDLFFKYEWHNILHQIVLNIMLFIIQNSDKSKIRAYLKYLLVDQKLTEQMINQVGDTLFYFDKTKYPDRSTTKGYLGYVIKIADAIEKFYESSTKNRINGDMLEWHDETWVSFTENTLGIHKEKGCKDLGNFNKYINGEVPAETAGGEDDMAIYREYERQQAADRMNQRQSYLEQVELSKFYEQKKTKKDQQNPETPKKEDQQILDPTAQPNSSYGVSSVRSQEPLSAQKQNIMFVQMDSKKLDEDIQMEDDEEDTIKRNAPINNEEIGNNQSSPVRQQKNESSISVYNGNYVSDNPIIREIMEKYSPTKGLIITPEGGIVSPLQPEEKQGSLINVQPIVSETEQEIIIEKQVIEPVFQEKVDQHDEATIIQSQQEGLVNNPNVDQQQTIQEQSDNNTISNVADDGEDDAEEENIRNQEFENTKQPIHQMNSDNDLDRLKNIEPDQVDEVKSSTELGEDVDQKQLTAFQDEIKKQTEKQSQEIAQHQEDQDTGIVEKDPISSSPEKPENIIEATVEQINQNSEKEIEGIIEKPIEDVPVVSERLNHFMSTTSATTSGERNKSAEAISNRLLQKKPSLSHSPSSHNKEVNQALTSPKKSQSNQLIPSVIEQVEEAENVNKEDENIEKQEKVIEQVIELISVEEKQEDEEEVQVKLEEQEINKDQKEETPKKEIKQDAEVIIETQLEKHVQQQEAHNDTEIEVNVESSEVKAQTTEFLKETGIQEYQYVLLNKPELRNSPLIEQFEHNVQIKKTTLFTSQEIKDTPQEIKETPPEIKETPKETGNIGTTHTEDQKELGDNLIKVEKTEFKTFVFEEEAGFEPINIELDRVYDREETEQKINTSNNPSPLNQVFDSLNSLNNFKYEMKYVQEPASIKTYDQPKNEVITPKETEKIEIPSTQTTTVTTKITQGGVTTTETTTTTTSINSKGKETIKEETKVEKTTPTASPSNQFDNKMEISEEGQIPALTYDDSDPTIKQSQKKFGQEQIDNQTKSLPSNAFRMAEDMSSSANLGTADPQRLFGSSPMKFKQQFQDNMRASLDLASIQRINPQPSSNQPISASVEATPSNLGEIKLGSAKSSETNNSPSTQKVKFLQQSQQERIQIQQMLLQKYGKGSSKNNSPQNNTPELKPADPYQSVSPAHQQFNYKLQSPYDLSGTPTASTHQQVQQTVTIGGNQYNVISKQVHTHSNQNQQQQLQQQQPFSLSEQKQIQPQYQQQQAIQVITQAEKMSYVEQETVLLQQKLISSKDYQLIQVQIRDMQNVYDIISEDNTLLIEQRIITSQNIRQTFFEVAERSRLQLDSTIDGLEQDKQRQEKELKLQYQTEFEMIERQMKQEQDEQKARKKTQDFLQKLLVDRVNKLYEIHLKYSLQQKISLEKAILEAKNLNEKLHSMHLLVAPAKQISPEKERQLLNTDHPNFVQPIQQNIQPQQIYIQQQQQQSTLAPQIPKPTQDDNELDKYLVSTNTIPRQYHSVPSTNTTELATTIKPSANLTVNTGSKNANTSDEKEAGSNSPCFGNKDPLKIPIHKQSEDSNTSSGAESDQQNKMYTSQGESTSPCFGNRKSSPQRKSSFSQRYGGRKLSGNNPTETDSVLEDPYDYKASSSARDKSPMPSQAAMYMSPHISAANSNPIPGASNDYLRRLTQPTTLTTAANTSVQQAPFRLSNPTNLSAYQSGPQNLLPQQQQQLPQQTQHQRIFDNYVQPTNPYQIAEEQLKMQGLPNPSNRQAQNVFYENNNSGANSPRRFATEQYVIQQTRSSVQPQMQQLPPIPQQQQQLDLQQQQQPQYRKIFSQTPVQAISKQYPPSNSSNVQINLQNPTQQPQQMQQSQQVKQPSQQQQQQQLQQQQQFLNYNYSTPQLQTKQNSQPEDQYKKISENLKLSAYYGQQGTQVKTISIDLSGGLDERKTSDYVSSSSKQTEQQPQRANQSAIYVSQKQVSQPIHQQRGSYGQIPTPNTNISDQNEIENQMQFKNYLSNPQQSKSTHNTPGNGSTPVGSSNNLQYSNQPQLTPQPQQLNNKLLAQTTYQEQVTRQRPLSHSEIMYKTAPNLPAESQFTKYGSPHTSSPQPGSSYSTQQYTGSSFSQANQQQQYLVNPQNPILNNEIQQIISKYTQGKDPNAAYQSQNPQNQQQNQYQYQQPQKNLMSDKNNQYADDYSSGYNNMKNSSTNYSTYSGGSGSFYNQQQNDTLNSSEVNDQESISSTTSSSQFFENIAGGGKKIKVVLKKTNPINKPQQNVNDPGEYMRQQQLMNQKQQQFNQQQLQQSQSTSSIKQSRHIEEKDKQFLQMIKK